MNPDPQFLLEIKSAEQLLRQSASGNTASVGAVEDYLDALHALGLQVLAKPDVEAIKAWLQVQEAVIDYAIEGVSEITKELATKHEAEIREALQALTPQSRERVGAFVDELLGRSDDDALAMVADSESLAAPAGPHVPLPANLHGSFHGTGTFTSSRGFPAKSGILTLRDTRGNEHRFDVNSGGGAATYTQRNGWTPPGIYRISNHRPNRTTAGMVLNGEGYSFDVDPTDGTNVFGRSLFRIHPDGGSEGTNGCLGVRESAQQLRACESIIADLIEEHGSFKLQIRYA